MNEKTTKPPYCSYRSFENLIKEFKDHSVLPNVIDRSLLSRRSGSEQSALILALKWFGFIDESSVPTTFLRQLVSAEDDASKLILRERIESSYAFIEDGSIDLSSATSQQMSDRFRKYDISGSTLSKSVAFFLAAAKDAGIQISPHVKAPASRTNGSVKRKPKMTPPNTVASEDTTEKDHPQRHQAKPGTITIPIPIYGMNDGSIHLPAEMDERQWNSVIKMTEFILKNYRDTMAEPEGSAKDDEDDL